MENLLKLLLEPLVKDPSSIKIEKDQQDNILKFTVSVPQEDIAKVIGKEGKMVKAIKSLLKVRAAKEKVFVTLEIQEA